MHNHHVDSTISNDFIFRDDDIIIDTYAKSGTTWVQQIIAQLLFPGEETDLSAISPWLDLQRWAVIRLTAPRLQKVRVLGGSSLQRNTTAAYELLAIGVHPIGD